jgi:hypothetical protein
VNSGPRNVRFHLERAPIAERVCSALHLSNPYLLRTGPLVGAAVASTACCLATAARRSKAASARPCVRRQPACSEIRSRSRPTSSRVGSWSRTASGNAQSNTLIVAAPAANKTLGTLVRQEASPPTAEPGEPIPKRCGKGVMNVRPRGQLGSRQSYCARCWPRCSAASTAIPTRPVSGDHGLPHGVLAAVTATFQPTQPVGARRRCPEPRPCRWLPTAPCLGRPSPRCGQIRAPLLVRARPRPIPPSSRSRPERAGTTLPVSC